MGQRIRCGILAAICLGSLAAGPSTEAAGLPVPLAQAPAPGPGAPAAPGAPLPANVTVPGRYYVVESIVVGLLVAGALFAVCRSSGRT